MEDVLGVLEGAGCRIDKAQRRIYFPRSLVNEMVAKAPGEFVLYSRNGQNLKKLILVF